MKNPIILLSFWTGGYTIVTLVILFLLFSGSESFEFVVIAVIIYLISIILFSLLIPFLFKDWFGKHKITTFFILFIALLPFIVSFFR